MLKVLSDKGLVFFVRTAGRFLFLLMIIAAFSQSLEIVESWMLKNVINSLLIKNGTNPVDLSLIWFSAMVTTHIVYLIGYHTFHRLNAVYTPSVKSRTLLMLFGHLLGHSPRFFEVRRSGELVSSIIGAAQAMERLIFIVAFDLTRVLSLIVFSTIFLAALRWEFGLLLFVWVTIYTYGSLTLATRSRNMIYAYTQKSNNVAGELADVITNFETVCAFAARDHELTRAGRLLEQERRLNRDSLIYLTKIRTFKSILLIVLSVVLGVLLVSGEALKDVGGFAMAFNLIRIISTQLWGLSNSILSALGLIATVEAAVDLILVPHDAVEHALSNELIVAKGSIELNGVSGGYKEGNLAVSNVSLFIDAGEKIGIVGPSGAGKSTLLKLMRGQLAATRGTILVDNQDISRVTFESLSRGLVIVDQRVGIFHRSASENIGYGSPNVKESEINAAAELARCNHFLSNKDGLKTNLGEGGTLLSGGERQRIGLARSLVKRPKILLLDEATAALDAENESAILTTLLNRLTHCTVIAVTHRLATVHRFDKVVYMEDGGIVEVGSHGELLAKNGKYAKLWSSQKSFSESGAIP